MHGDVKEAFLTFLSHTGGVDESSGIETFTLENWSAEKAAALYSEFDRIEKVPSKLQNAAGTAIMEALAPWLHEFGKLGTRGKNVIDCISYFKEGNVDKFWISYIENKMTQEEQISYSCYPVGENRLQPFCEGIMKEMVDSFSATLTGDSSVKVDFQNYISSTGRVEYKIPAHANTCRLLTGCLPENETVIFRQLDTKGGLVAEFVVRTPYTEFDLKQGSIKVDVLGEVDIYETIFVYL
jgi:hyaluronoglucosaminidase